MRRRVAVVIPALDEAGHIAHLVAETADQPVDEVIVVDNGSSDGTGRLAADAGATVIYEPRRGYGYACAAGATAALKGGSDIVVFMDGDFSSHPAEIPYLLQPITSDNADLVLGSRILGQIVDGAMPLHQRLGNQISSRLMNWLYRVNVTDLGPFRAIRGEWFDRLDMREMTFGWPTEMMVKVARRQGRIVEVPVSWHSRRTGRSKVGGTIRGSMMAAYFILGVTLRNVRW